MVFVGIDWSETSHDVEVLGEDGRRLKALRIQHGVEGAAKLQEVLAELTAEPSEVVVAVESTHGLLVNLVIGSGYRSQTETSKPPVFSRCAIAPPQHPPPCRAGALLLGERRYVGIESRTC